MVVPADAVKDIVFQLGDSKDDLYGYMVDPETGIINVKGLPRGNYLINS